MGTIIEFKNVWKNFGSNRVLEDFNLQINEGETFTIIGGSGTGKSVALKILLGLFLPDKGDVFFKSHNVVDMNEEELVAMRSKIGMVFQGASLFDSLTVFENVAYPVREHFNYPPEKIEKIVKEKLKLVALEGSEDTYPSDLSGGMKKRVALARAIATDPEVILYDEPTTGLDPSNTNRINELIRNLQKVLKVTSVVVTHDMESAFKVSNRIGLLSGRKIAFLGTVAELRTSRNPEIQSFIQGQVDLSL